MGNFRSLHQQVVATKHPRDEPMRHQLRGVAYNSLVQAIAHRFGSTSLQAPWRLPPECKQADAGNKEALAGRSLLLWPIGAPSQPCGSSGAPSAGSPWYRYVVGGNGDLSRIRQADGLPRHGPFGPSGTSSGSGSPGRMGSSPNGRLMTRSASAAAYTRLRA